jgi:hypothetical protein
MRTKTPAELDWLADALDRQAENTRQAAANVRRQAEEQRAAQKGQ